MSQIDFYTCVGFSLTLLAQSKAHAAFPMTEYFQTEILPPLMKEQAKFYATEHGAPVAFVTWAWLDPSVEREILTSGRAIRADEWNCGKNLFFNDWITPYGNLREVVKDMTTGVFPDHKATSVRRNPDGTIRRTCKWTGLNVRT